MIGTTLTNKIVKLLHLHGLHIFINTFLVNKIYIGTNSKFFEKKRKLLVSIGYIIGEKTKIVGPIENHGTLSIGKNCWIGKNLVIEGNGFVTIGDNCDIAPEVTFLTGGHKIGNSERRAGEGESYNIDVGDGTWIGSQSTVLSNTSIGKSCVVASCACVNKSVPDNMLIGGVPAKIIKDLTGN